MVQSWLESEDELSVLPYVNRQGAGKVSGTFALWWKRYGNATDLGGYADQDQRGWEDFAEGFSQLYHGDPVQRLPSVERVATFLREVARAPHHRTWRYVRELDPEKRPAARAEINALLLRLGLTPPAPVAKPREDTPYAPHF